MTTRLNNSTTLLVGDAVFYGQYENMSEFEAVSISVDTDQSGTVKVHWSNDGKTNDFNNSYSVTGGTPFHKVVISQGRWWKVEYTNGAVTQTSFNLKANYKSTHGFDHSVALDLLDSSLNTIEANSTFTASRLNNIQNKLSQNTDGTGSTAGQMLDGCDSSLNTIESNSTLTASRLNNVQNKLSENADGSGDSAGILLKAIDTKNQSIINGLTNLQNYPHTLCGTQANLMNGVSCAAIGTTSSQVDFFLLTAVPKRITILVNCTSGNPVSNGFEVWASADATTWCRVKIDGSYAVQLTNTDIQGNGINTEGGCTSKWSMRYLKIKVFALGTFTATVVGLA